MFPLSTALLPGTLLPLHIFEPRYRQLVADLVDGTVPDRSFGVVLVRAPGHGDVRHVEQVHTVGCSAMLREARRHPDGRFDIVTVGSRRFRLLRITHGHAPYLMGTVEWLPDTDVDPRLTASLPMLARAALAVHERYCAVLWQPEDWLRPPPDTDPALLSHMLAADCLLPVADRQRALEERDPFRRLHLVHQLLSHETGLLRALRAVPAPPPELGGTARRN